MRCHGQICGRRDSLLLEGSVSQDLLHEQCAVQGRVRVHGPRNRLHPQPAPQGASLIHLHSQSHITAIIANICHHLHACHLLTQAPENQWCSWGEQMQADVYSTHSVIAQRMKGRAGIEQAESKVGCGGVPSSGTRQRWSPEHWR